MRILALLAVCLLTAPLLAGFAQRETPVAPITIMPAGPAPKVVSTYPAEGASVTPGVLVLKAVFDQPMEMADFAYGPGASGEAPDCVKTPRLLNDGKTFVLLCRAWPGKSYSVTFNPKAGEGFANAGGHRAETSTLSFTTTTADPVRTMSAAMKAAGLSDIDNPVQETSNHAARPADPLP